MKFYATVKSERAKKGQGGNKYLDICLTVKDGQRVVNFGHFTLKEGETPDGNEGIVLVDSDDEVIKWFEFPKKKAEKEKGDCEHNFLTWYDQYQKKCRECNAIIKTSRRTP